MDSPGKLSAPRLTEFKQHSDNAVPWNDPWACPPVYGQELELDFMIPMGPFQLKILYVSVVYTQKPCQ